MVPVQPVKFLFGNPKKGDMIGLSKLNDFTYFLLSYFLLDQYFIDAIGASFNDFKERIKATYLFHLKS